MVCEDTALTCAVRDLNETLQSGPSWFDWLALLLGAALSVATLVVSALVSAVTLFVAWRSYRVSQQATAAAQRATELAALVRQDEINRDMRRDRDLFAADVEDWIEQWVVLFRDASDENYEATAASAARLTHQARSLNAPNAVELIGDIRHAFLSDWDDAFEVDEEKARTAAALNFVRSWVLDPTGQRAQAAGAAR